MSGALGVAVQKSASMRMTSVNMRPIEISQKEKNVT